MFSSNVPVTSAPAAVPSVRDLLIDLTLVDPSGARRKIKGVIGKKNSRKGWKILILHKF
jgi:hypothetical protein